MSNIDLWLENLLLSNADIRHYWQLLSHDEQTKSLSFKQQKHQQYYIASHGKLRTILSDYTNTHPKHLEFKHTEFGKPYLSNHKLSFNLSHTENKMLLAVGYGDIGVDIETWHTKIDFLAIAKLCFAECEIQHWQQTAKAEKHKVFFQYWTRKESFIKAVGLGLNIDVAKVISSPNKTQFIHIPEQYGKPKDWQLIDLALNSGISAALTLKNQNCSLNWCNNDFL